MRTRGPGESALLLLEAVAVLVTRQIDYAVIGAVAASVHGAVRASMDADVVLSLPIREAIELEGAFKQAGFRTQFSRGENDDPIPGMLRLSDEHANAVDLLIGLRGMEAEAFSRAIEVAFQGVKVKFIGLEDFIAMKVFAAGAMDLMDASRAIAVSRKSVDVSLVRRLAGNYGGDAAAALEALLEN